MITIKVFIVTGVSSGLGKSIFDLLIKKNQIIVALSRTFNEYQLELQKGNKVELLTCDLSMVNQLQNILNNISLIDSDSVDEIIFINNAATINPISQIGDFSKNDIIDSISINLSSSIIINNYLCKISNKNDLTYKIVNITTGAARRPIEGWAMYCTTKSAVEMFLEVIELENDNVKVINVDPGVINTGMQEKIRNSSEEDFPLVEQFKKIDAEDKLKSPDDVALEIIEGNHLI